VTGQWLFAESLDGSGLSRRFDQKSITQAPSWRFARRSGVAQRPAVAVVAGAQTQFQPAKLVFTLERDSLDSNFRALL